MTDDDHLAEPMWAAGPTVAAPREREFSDIEVLRLWGALLHRAAGEIGVSLDGISCYDLEEQARQIVLASQGSCAKLPPSEYRLIYEIWQLLRRKPLQPPPAA